MMTMFNLFNKKKVKIPKKELSEIGKRLTKYEIFLIDKKDLKNSICPECNAKRFVKIGNTISFEIQYHCEKCGMMYEIRKQHYNREQKIHGVNHGVRNVHLCLPLNREWKINKIKNKIKNG